MSERASGTPARGSVLVADDNADRRESVARLLRPLFDVGIAVDGAAALEHVRRRPWDLVLAAVKLPRLDGFELLTALRSDPETASIRVVLLSTGAGEASGIEGLAAGADEYLTEPYSARELIATVRGQVGQLLLRREYEARERSLQEKATAAAAQLDRILSEAGEGFVAFDREYRCVAVNASAEQMLGVPNADLLGRTPGDLFPAEGLAELHWHVQEAVARSTVIRFETHVRVWDRWFENRASPSPDGVSVFFSDITARKRTEASLRRSEEAQRLLVSMHDAVRGLGDPEQVMWACVSRVGEHFEVNRCTYGEIDPAQTNFTVRRDYTRGVASIAGTHQLDKFGPRLTEELKSGRTLTIDDAYNDPRATGASSRAAFEAIEVRASVSVPLIASGRLVAFLAIHHRTARVWSPDEVTLLEQVAERMWFAVENARAEAKLREHRDVLALAMGSGRMGAWSRNEATNAVWWSRELEELFGLEPGGFEGTEDGFIAFIHPDDRPAVAAAAADAVRDQRDYVIEFRFRHASGEWRWMDGRGRAVYASDGRPLMLYGLGIDITERKQAEQALAVARDAAETANRVKDQFLATLSHELRTPLNAILGYVQMLRSNALPLDKRARALEIVERNAVIQNQLVEDLLDISRITTGKVRLDTEPLPLARPLEEAIESVRPAVEAKRIALELDIDRRAGVVKADAGRLQQVFWNLLSNAVKFTGEGGSVRVSLGRDQGSLRVVVTDTGLGMTPEFLPHVFEPFRQEDDRSAREHGGLGLGLGICKQLVELHGGTITAASDGPGRGAVFTVRLPEYLGTAPQADRRGARRATPPPDPATAPAMPLRGRDVIVVDEDGDARDLLRQILENADATVRTVASAAEALAEIDRRPPDLIVIDLGLTGTDGYDLVRQIREGSSARGRQVPALAVTGYTRLDDRVRSLAAGFDGHIAKPVDPDRLVAAVVEVMRAGV